jgi:hypothetical protein
VVYSSKALATELGVSNGPIREAMLALVDDGLMEAVANKGFRTVPLTPADLAEICEMRLLLEVPAVARLAKGDLPVDRVARLTDLVNTIERTARSGDLTSNLAADRDFHLSLLAAGATADLSVPSPGCATRPACTTCARLMPTAASSPQPVSTDRCLPQSCTMTSAPPNVLCDSTSSTSARTGPGQSSSRPATTTGHRFIGQLDRDRLPTGTSRYRLLPPTDQLQTAGRPAVPASSAPAALTNSHNRRKRATSCR